MRHTASFFVIFFVGVVDVLAVARPQLENAAEDLFRVLPIDLPSVIFQPKSPDFLKPLDRDIGNEILSDCGNDTDILHLHYVYLDPPQPQRGQPMKITAEGLLDDDIVEGTKVHVLAKMGVVKLLDKVFDFCQEVIQHVDMQCPVNKGLIKLEKVVDIPSEVPPGKFYVQARVFMPDGDDRQVACLRGTVTIKL